MEVTHWFGIGDLDSIVWGLEYAIQHILQKPEGRTIVSFSSCYDLPSEGEHCHMLPAEDSCFPDLFTEGVSKTVGSRSP